MQVFLPYNTLTETAACLFKDKKRYNKQIIECGQIIAAIKGGGAWSNHPIVWQYRDYVDYLICYKAYLEHHRDGYTNTKMCDTLTIPPFLSDQDYLDSHKRRLYQKNPEAFAEFAEYDIEGDMANLYCVPLDFHVPKRKGVSVVKMCEKYKVVRYE